MALRSSLPGTDLSYCPLLAICIHYWLSISSQLASDRCVICACDALMLQDCFQGLYEPLPDRVWGGLGDVLFLVQAAAITVSSALDPASFLKISLQEWTDNYKRWCYCSKQLKHVTMAWMVSSNLLARVACSHPCSMMYAVQICKG